jgi:hypothetical protein
MRFELTINSSSDQPPMDFSVGTWRNIGGFLAIEQIKCLQFLSISDKVFLDRYELIYGRQV